MNYKGLFAILLSAIIIVSCTIQPEEVLPIAEGTTIHAYTSHTRTTFDGEQSAWSDGDQMQVAIGATDGTLQVAEFTLQNAKDGIFRNEELELNSNILYNAYALYSAQGTLPNTSTKSAVVQVGAASQTQNGTSTAHIAPLDPLFGKAEGVYANAIGMQMHHSAVVLRLNIQNVASEPISGISSVKIVAPTGVSLSGERTIDLAAEPKEAISGADGTNTLTINVDSSGSVPTGSTFTVWAAAAPFKIAAGEKLQFIVTTTDDNVLECTKSFEQAVTFESGSIMQTTIMPAPRAEQIVLRWGYLDGYTSPAGMPECASDNLNASSANSNVNIYGIMEKCYPIGDWEIRVAGDVKHAYVVDQKCVRFRDVTNTKCANIYFPVIADYKLSKVVVTIPNAKTSTLKVGIRPEIASLGDRNTQLASATFDLDTSDAAQQYNLHIYNSQDQKVSYDLSGIELTYTLGGTN